MDTLEEALELLSAIVKRSRSKKLKVAFVNYIDEFNKSMRAYIAFLEILRGAMLVSPREQSWDVAFERRRE